MVHLCCQRAQVVTIKTDDSGNIDMADLKAKVEKYADNLGAFMVRSVCF